MPKEIILREFAYFDRQKVEDFLSGIENGLARETTETRTQIAAEAKGRIGVPHIAELEGGIGRKGIELQELKASTDSSLFQRLYSHLKERQLIKVFEKVDEGSWNQIGVGDVLELIGKIELSAMENLIDLLGSYLPVVKSAEMDEKTRQTVLIIEMMKSAQTGVNIKVILRDGNYGFVATLSKSNLKTAKQDLNSEYNVLCRVQRKLKSGEAFDLFSFIPGLRLPRDQIRTMIRTFPPNLTTFLGKPLNIKNFRISYPATIVTPIAIYR
jgi:hypothetical protein